MTTETIRPAPPEWGAPGHEWVVAPDTHTRWKLDVAGKTCRFGSQWSGWCRKPAVAAMDRGRTGKPQWYSYCGDHMYDRWVEDGVVVLWRLVNIREEAP